MIPKPVNFPATEPVFPNLAQSGLVCAARLLYAVLLTLARHGRLGLHMAGYPTRLVEVIRAMRYAPRFKAPVAEVQVTAFEREARVSVAVRLGVSFWAWLLGVPVAELYETLRAPDQAPLRRALGLADDGICYPQRVAELHSRLGPEGVAHCREVLVQVLLAHVPAERLSETDVEAMAWSAEQGPQLLKVGYAHGWGYLVTFAFWQGVLADLEAAWRGEPAPNGYPLREVLVAYLQRVVYTAETLTALGDEVRNAAWDEQLDAPKVVVLHRQLVRRVVRRHGRRRFRAAVDNTVLAVVGSHYEQAGKHFVPQAGRAGRGYRLYVLFLLDERVPVAFFIQEDVAAWEESAEVGVAEVLDQLALEGASLAQAAPNPADVLWRLVDESCQVLGVSHLGVVLCDRHFWHAQTMTDHARPGQEWPVTPARDYQNVRQALRHIPAAEWQRLGVNERVAETTIRFGRGNRTTHWRLVAFKRLGRVPR